MAGIVNQPALADLSRPARRIPRVNYTFNATDFGARRGGDITIALNAAITAAADAGGGTVVVPPSSSAYLALGVVMRSNIRLILEGATIRKNGGGVGTHIIDMTGVTTATSTTLTANAAIGDTVLTVTSETGFSVGDIVLVGDENFVTGAVGRNQEINRVTAVSANSITVANRLIGAYVTASTADIVVITPIENARIEGGRLELPTASNNGGGIYGTHTVNCSVKEVVVSGPNDDAGIYFLTSVGALVHGCRVIDGQNLTGSGFAYGVLFENSHHCKMESCHTENIRENLVTNRARFCQIIGNTDRGSEDNSWNTHGSLNSHIIISKNISSSTNGSGITVGFSTHTGGDSDILISDNIISFAGVHGISVSAPSGSENLRVTVRDNHVIRYGVRAASSVGVLMQQTDQSLVASNSINGVTSNAANGVHILACNNLDVLDNKVDNLPNGFGLTYQDACDRLNIRGNVFSNISSNNVRTNSTASTNVIVEDNIADDDTVDLGINISRRNTWDVVKTFTNADTTPSVAGAGGHIFKTNNSGATSITDFNDGYDGQEIVILFRDANTTIVDGTPIVLATGADLTGGVDDVLRLVSDGTTWFESGRSV